MSHSPVSQGQCGSCGKADRLLLPQEEDGHCYCNVCSLLVSIQRMTSRLDSESDHRIVRLYQDLQTAAQRFWSTPQGMNYQFSTGIADHLSTHPTPIMPTTRMTSNPAVLPPDDTLPPIIPPPTLIAHAGDPNLGCPHRTTALAPSIVVDTPIYNAFAPGTTQQTPHFFTHCYSHGLASDTKSRIRVPHTSALLSPTRVSMQLLPLPANRLRMYSLCHPHMFGLQHVHLSWTLSRLLTMWHWAAVSLLRDLRTIMISEVLVRLH